MVALSFVSKVSKVKTRTKGNKSYYICRINIPNEVSEKLGLTKEDYLFVQGAMKAKWYHMLNWKEMNKTWELMPIELKKEISKTGIEVPQIETAPTLSGVSPTHFVGHASTVGLTSVRPETIPNEILV
jgi:hypothetical protein